MSLPIFWIPSRLHAVDNVSDTQASVDEARRYLAASLPAGSIVVVTARGRGTLMRVRPYLTESNVLGMPELDVEEAKSLFVASSNFEPRGEADEELVLRCVRRCHFVKDDGSGSKQYHPLTLDVLGKQLGCMDPREWKAELDRIDEDIFNQSGEAEHPIFSILRKSYDTLTSDDQLLFMDVALGFTPQLQSSFRSFDRDSVSWPILLEWLGMVHGVSADGVMRRLERLKRKSLLERFGDGSKVKVGMHDLWHAFCKAEVETGELRGRRWVYGAKGSDLVNSSPPGRCWENVKRMALCGREWMQKLERVQFAEFSNVTVLMMTGLDMTEEVVLDVSGLIHLKSLEVGGRGSHLLDLQGLPRCLIFLRWKSYDYPSGWPYSLQSVEEVAFLTELQYLVLMEYSGGELPDMSRLTSLRRAIFYECMNVKMLTGLSSKLCNLHVLVLIRCRQLRSCPEVGDLVGLEELNCGYCEMLERLPNLGRLRNLRILIVSGSPLITDIPGLGAFAALEELRAGLCTGESYIFHLPDMRKLSKLRVLDLGGRRLEAVVGLESLDSLQELETDFRGVAERPSLRQLTMLQTLEIHGWSLEGLEELGNLAMLRTLDILDCSGVDKLPDIGSLLNLQNLGIEMCEFSDVSVVSGLSALETLSIRWCKKVERLPVLEGLSRLNELRVSGCPMLRSWNRVIEGAVEGIPCRSGKSSEGSDLSCCWRPTGLRSLVVWSCRSLDDVTGIGAFSQLERLVCGCLTVEELPDLSNFPRLKSLYLHGCTRLRRLTCCEPIHALLFLCVEGCSSLTTLPDLSCFPGLADVQLHRCERLSTLSSVGPLTALRSLILSGCISLNALPDLGMFPALETLRLEGCSGLTTVSSSVRLPALKELVARGCESVRDDFLEQLRALCPQCRIKCSALPVTQVESDLVRSGALESGGGKKWRRWAVGSGGKILALRKNIWCCRCSGGFER